MRDKIYYALRDASEWLSDRFCVLEDWLYRRQYHSGPSNDTF